MKILVSGGRTGGHLVPGIALYTELNKRNIDTSYVMSEFDLKFPITARVNEKDRILLELKSISRKLSWKTPFYIWKIFRSFLSIFGVIRKLNPAAVIITGGYISNPVALSAIILGKPLFIIEQNSVAGITNRMYGIFARKIYTSYEKTLKIPQNKAVLTGNPSIFKDKIDRKTARDSFQMGAYKTVVGVTGGSQGSRVLNEAVLKIADVLKEKGVGLIWSVGSVEYKKWEAEGKIKSIGDRYPNIRLYQFIERMDAFFSSLDLVISRAGATSISEIIHYEVPALFIPIKNSPDNHQYLNAKFLEDHKAAIILEEDALNPEILRKTLTSLENDLSAMGRNIHSLKEGFFQGKPEEVIIDSVLAEINYKS